jgi:hydroxyacylglutathione hydrolase
VAGLISPERCELNGLKGFRYSLKLKGVTLYQFPVLQDNYCYLLISADSPNSAIVVDPSEAKTPLKALQALEIKKPVIFLTHHHNDHCGGVAGLVESFPHAEIYGFAGDDHRLPPLTQALSQKQVIVALGMEWQVMHAPGHTLGHILYFNASLPLLFCGDTLFSLGCGRLFEGTASQMHASLQQIAALPAETYITCAHEYTASNGRFAATVEGNNPALQQRLAEVARLRAAQLPTVPVALETERATNPFLRCDSPEIRHSLGMTAQVEDSLVFAELRRRKDSF